MKQRLWMLCLLAAAAALPGQEAPEVSITISPRNVTVGDRIEIRTVVKTIQEWDWVITSFKGGDVEIIGQLEIPAKRLPPYNVYEHLITAAAFRTGAVPLGPFEVSFYRNKDLVGSVTVEAQMITVQSILKKEDRDISPIKGPVSLEGNPIFLLRPLLALLLLLGLLLLFFVLRKRKRALPAAPPPALSLEDELVAKLQELLAMPWLQRREFRPFFIRLTEIWKGFMQGYYQFSAEDFTTHETLDALKWREENARVQSGIQEILETSDGVKFAKSVPSRERLESLLRQMEDLLEEYRRRRKERVEAERAAAGR